MGLESPADVRRVLGLRAGLVGPVVEEQHLGRVRARVRIRVRVGVRVRVRVRVEEQHLGQGQGQG